MDYLELAYVVYGASKEQAIVTLVDTSNFFNNHGEEDAHDYVYARFTVAELDRMSKDEIMSTLHSRCEGRKTLRQQMAQITHKSTPRCLGQWHVAYRQCDREQDPELGAVIAEKKTYKLNQQMYCQEDDHATKRRRHDALYNYYGARWEARNVSSPSLQGAQILASMKEEANSSSRAQDTRAVVNDRAQSAPSGHCNSLQLDLNRTKQQLDDKDARIKELTVQLEEKTALVRRQETQLESEAARISELQAQLDARTAEIRKMKTGMDKVKADCNDLRTSKQNLDQQVQQKIDALKDQEKRLKQTSTAVKEKSAKLESALNQLKQKTDEFEGVTKQLQQRTSELKAAREAARQANETHETVANRLSSLLQALLESAKELTAGCAERSGQLDNSTPPSQVSVQKSKLDNEGLGELISDVHTESSEGNPIVIRVHGSQTEAQRISKLVFACVRQAAFVMVRDTHGTSWGPFGSGWGDTVDTGQTAEQWREALLCTRSTNRTNYSALCKQLQSLQERLTACGDYIVKHSACLMPLLVTKNMMPQAECAKCVDDLLRVGKLFKATSIIVPPWKD